MARRTPNSSPREWSVYIARCADGSLYTGVAKDARERLRLHNAGKGAAYTRSRRPIELVYLRRGFTRSGALVREAGIKALSRMQKKILVEGV